LLGTGTPGTIPSGATLIVELCPDDESSPCALVGEGSTAASLSGSGSVDYSSYGVSASTPFYYAYELYNPTTTNNAIPDGFYSSRYSVDVGYSY